MVDSSNSFSLCIIISSHIPLAAQICVVILRCQNLMKHEKSLLDHGSDGANESMFLVDIYFTQNAYLLSYLPKPTSKAEDSKSICIHIDTEMKAIASCTFKASSPNVGP